MITYKAQNLVHIDYSKCTLHIYTHTHKYTDYTKLHTTETTRHSRSSGVESLLGNARNLKLATG